MIDDADEILPTADDEIRHQRDDGAILEWDPARGPQGR